ncbi:hypothetical protein [Variovorax sp. WS11]|uniref:hypothetical protein n=1 Tax=Variovorax sp. WS11 TaxID=1105204 RepID=UPI001EF3C9A9|nr:hypothetical protein [Variovorax sp. WS11]
MFGSLPLMILKHDTPLDARFIRGLFDVYYKAVMVTAAAGALTHTVSERPVIAMGMAGIALIAFASSRGILSRMDRLREAMTGTDTTRIRRFRWLHVWGMVLNVAQLVLICIGMVKAL